jgi:hypothetical protein
MTTLQEMDERMRSIQTDLRGLAEIQNPSDEDVIVQDSLIAEYSKLEADAAPLRKRMQELDRIRTLAGADDNKEEATSTRSVGGLTLTRSKRDPLDLNAVHDNLVRGDELRHRAVDLIERDNKEQRWEFSDEAAQAATLRAQYSPQIGRHILLTGSDEYREAFRSYMMDGDDVHFRDIRLANASGGYLLPYVLDPTIVLTNSGSSANLLAVSCLTSTSLGDRALTPGDEVVTVAAGFPTTVNPISSGGIASRRAMPTEPRTSASPPTNRPISPARI